jgi:hypothetical protein
MESQLPLIGMDRERQRLALAFARRESLLLLGRAGSGKTRLIQEALSNNGEILYLPWERSLHALLAAMMRLLIATGRSGFMRHAKPGDVDRWLGAQKSIHLKGLLWSAFETCPVPIVLDGITGAGFSTYHFLQRVYHIPGMAVYAASRDQGALGVLRRLFWHPERIMNIPRLHDSDAEQLFEMAADHFHLRHLDLAEFREKVLESADGNPGQLIEMCRLATQPRYISGRYVKFSPLRIDTVIRFGK